MKYFWTATFSLPHARDVLRRVTMTKPCEGKDYMEMIEKLLYNTIISILGPKYTETSKKPDIRLNVACLNKRGMQRKLAKKMKKRLEDRLFNTGKQLELF